MTLLLSPKNIFFIIILNYSFSLRFEIEKRIKNGKDSPIEDFPHAVALEWLFGVMIWGVPIGSWIFTCGGSIIHEEWILTARHCLGNNYFRVIYGTDYVSIFWESSDNYIHAAELWQHEYNDLGLIRLAEKLEFSEKVKSINTNLTFEIKNTSTAKMAGWGYPENKFFTYRALYLKSIDLSIDTLFSEPIIIDGLNKSGGGCSGDSGNGLVTYEGDYLIGVFSASLLDLEGNDYCTRGICESIWSNEEWILKITGIREFNRRRKKRPRQ